MPNREERRRAERDARHNPTPTVLTQLVVIDDDEAPLSDLLAAAVVNGIGSLIEQGGAPLEHCSIVLGSDHPMHPGKIVLELATDRMAPQSLVLEGKPLTLGDLKALTNTEEVSAPSDAATGDNRG